MPPPRLNIKPVDDTGTISMTPAHDTALSSSILEEDGLVQDIIRRIQAQKRLSSRKQWVARFTDLSTKLRAHYNQAKLCSGTSGCKTLGSGVFGTVSQIDSSTAQKILGVRKTIQHAYRRIQDRITEERLGQILDDIHDVFDYCDRVRTVLAHASKWYPRMFPAVYGCRSCMDTRDLKIQLEMSLFEGSTLASLLPSLSIDDRDRICNLVAAVWDDLNQKGIYHGDLHPGNVIVSEDLLDIYFIDFDSSVYRDDDIETAAPDALNFEMSMAAFGSGQD